MLCQTPQNVIVLVKENLAVLKMSDDCPKIKAVVIFHSVTSFVKHVNIICCAFFNRNWKKLHCCSTFVELQNYKRIFIVENDKL